MENNKIKKVIFLGRKKGAVKAVKYLLNKKIDVAIIVGVENDPSHKLLSVTAKKNNIPFTLDETILYDLIKKNDQKVQSVDLVISYLYSKKIRYPLIKMGTNGCINFHPAPLPDYKSSAGYNMAILERKLDYGVSVHFIDSEKFDQGPIIKVLKIPLTREENVISLYEQVQEKLLELFKDTIKLFQSGKKIQTIENKAGLYLDKKQLEALKKVDLINDDLELINRKVRAFFFPPYKGATIKIKDQEFTLVNDEILQYLDKLINK